MSSEFERIQNTTDNGFQHFAQTVTSSFYDGTKSFSQKCMELEEEFRAHQEDKEGHNWLSYVRDLGYTYEYLLEYFFTRLTGKESKKVTNKGQELDLMISDMLNDEDFKKNLMKMGRGHADDYLQLADDIRVIRNAASHPRGQNFYIKAKSGLTYLQNIVSITCDIVENLDPVLLLGENISASLKSQEKGDSRYLEVQIKGKQAAQKDLRFCWQYSSEGKYLDLPKERKITEKKISLPKYGDGQEYRCIVTSERTPGQVDCSFREVKAELKGSVSFKRNPEKNHVRTRTADVNASVNGKTIPRSELTFQWFDEANEKLPIETETITLPKRPNDKKYRCIITYKPVSGSIEGTFLDERPTLAGKVILEPPQTETKKNGIRMLKAVVKECKPPDSKLLYEWKDAKNGKILEPAGDNRVYRLPNRKVDLLLRRVIKKEYQCVVTSEGTNGELCSDIFRDVPPQNPKTPKHDIKYKKSIIMLIMSLLAGLIFIFVLSGIPTEWITFLTENPDTIFGLGVGLAEADQPDRAIKYFKIAANRGSEKACIELGDFYSYHMYFSTSTTFRYVGTHIDNISYAQYSDEQRIEGCKKKVSEEEVLMHEQVIEYGEEKALDWYQKAADMNNPQGLFRVAEILSHRESHDDTLIWDYLERAGDQWHSGALVKMAEGYESIEDYSNARRYYEKALGYDPDSTNVHLDFLNIDYMEKNIDPECGYYRAKAYEALGRFYEVEQDLEQAIFCYQKVLEVYPLASSSYWGIQDRLDALQTQLDQQGQPE